MSGTHVALLRGINVGKAKRIAMADLRRLFEELGYRGVRTVLNSGNVILTISKKSTGAPAPRIEQGIARRFPFQVPVTVLAAEGFKAALDDNPLARPDRDPKRLLVTFFHDPSAKAFLAPLAKKDWAPEELAIGRHAAYLWCPKGVLGGYLFEAVDRTLGATGTTRNVATLERLRDLIEA
jgi:uncharacterized protein (DUF1697 family)